jgi:ABC-type spermidine/putrescine transport system permease subunit II
MFNHENSYTIAMIAALAAAVVATLLALGHALDGFQTFW